MAEPATPAPADAKIKTRKPRQRACNEKSPKGKLCAGHLKRYYDYPKRLEGRLGQGAEVYRCHRCGTLYLPLTEELPRSYVLRY